MSVSRCCCGSAPEQPLEFFPICLEASREDGTSEGGARQGETLFTLGRTRPGADDQYQFNQHHDGAIYLQYFGRPYAGHVQKAEVTIYHDRQYDGVGTPHRPTISDHITGTMEGIDEPSCQIFPVDIYAWQTRNPQAFTIATGASEHTFDVTEYFNYCLDNFADLGSWRFAVRWKSDTDTPLLDPYTFNVEHMNPFQGYDYNGQYLYNHLVTELLITP